jgi:hypothetical protein
MVAVQRRSTRQWRNLGDGRCSAGGLEETKQHRLITEPVSGASSNSIAYASLIAGVVFFATRGAVTA